MSAVIIATLAVLTALLAALMLIQVVAGYRDARHLHQASASIMQAPRVSIIIAARNEERAIETALTSVLALDYPDYEVIVVDDRSEDATGALLDRMAAGRPRLRVLHVQELPPGWLGKNHALHRGAQIASGEWLLFTDADVVFHPTALTRAINLARELQVDHFSAIPEVPAPTIPLAAAIVFFTMGFTLALKPWKARDPKSKRFIGIGAFNLVRAATLRSLGGFERIRLRPDDDIRLGQLIKTSGARQQCVGGFGLLSVEWYRSLPDMARGLRKNMFAGVEYKLWRAVLAVVVLTLVHIWPFVAVWLTTGWVRILYACAAVCLMSLYAYLAVRGGKSAWLTLSYPLAACFFLYVICDAVVRTLRRGGIEWRGTFYSLEDLRANKI